MKCFLSDKRNDFSQSNINYLSQKKEGISLSGKEDAANNFARGHYTVGKEVIDMVGWPTLFLVLNQNKTLPGAQRTQGIECTT